MSDNCRFPLNPTSLRCRVWEGSYHQAIAGGLHKEFVILNQHFVDYEHERLRKKQKKASSSKPPFPGTICQFGPREAPRGGLDDRTFVLYMEGYKDCTLEERLRTYP